jgi:hypothetical protein
MYLHSQSAYKVEHSTMTLILQPKQLPYRSAACMSSVKQCDEILGEKMRSALVTEEYFLVCNILVNLRLVILCLMTD